MSSVNNPNNKEAKEKKKKQVKSVLRTISELREDDLETYSKVFALFDKKGTGKLGVPEILSTLKKVFQIEPTPDDEDALKKLLTFLDLGDKKGCINLEEFITYCESGLPLDGSTLRRSLRGSIIQAQKQVQIQPPTPQPVAPSAANKEPNITEFGEEEENVAEQPAADSPQRSVHSRRQSLIQPQIFESKKIQNKPLIDKEKQKKNYQDVYDFLKKFQNKESSSGSPTKNGSPSTPGNDNLTVEGGPEMTVPLSPIAFSPSQFSGGKGGLRPLTSDKGNSPSSLLQNQLSNEVQKKMEQAQNDQMVMAEMHEAFDFFDIHDHGLISAHDFCVIMSRFGLIRRPKAGTDVKKEIVKVIQQEELAMEELFKTVDSDGDGKITFDEFLLLFHKTSGL